MVKPQIWLIDDVACVHGPFDTGEALRAYCSNFPGFKLVFISEYWSLQQLTEPRGALQLIKEE